MDYQRFIRQRTVEMLNEKAERMVDEIRWLKNRQQELGEDHEWEINKKKQTLSGLRRRIAILADYYSDQS